MDLYKPVYEKLIKPAWLKYHDENHLKYLPEIEQFHGIDVDEIRAYQLKKLQKIIAEAYSSVPFYREEWDGIGLKPQDIQRLDDIKKIPILTKEKLRSHSDELVSDKADMDSLIVSGTGGTTDSPIKIMYDRERLLFKTAEMDFYRKWWGWEFGDKAAYLWGAPQDIPDINSVKWKVVNAFLGRKLFIFSSLMDDNVMEGYVEKINKFRPGIIQAYTNPIYILAQYVLKKNIPVHRVKSIILTAEPCHEYQREIIEKAFNAPVYTFYGCREAGYAGVECRERDGYHLNCSSLYTEIICGDSDAKSGEMGSVLFTDLLNTKMPFIRYQIGDMGIPEANPCACGSALPRMKFFAGRETDVFISPDGRYFPGISLNGQIIRDCKGIKALQFIQNESDKIMVKIVKGESFSEKDITSLDHEIFNFFQGSLQVSKTFVDEIPREKSGKTRVCICNIHKQV